MRQGICLQYLPVVLTAASIAGRAVSPTGGLPAAGGRCLGPASISAAAGERCPVARIGTEPWESGGAFAKGDKLQLDALGRVVVFAAGVFVGVAEEAATAAGQFPEVKIVDN